LEPSRRRRLGDLLDELDQDKGDLIFDLELINVADDQNDQGYYDDEPVTQDDVSFYSTLSFLFFSFSFSFSFDVILSYLPFQVRRLVLKSIEADQPDFYETIKDSTPAQLFKK
jgi:hypothetical protein